MNEEQLETIKDQGKKQLQLLTNNTNKESDIKSMSFKNKLNFESSKIYNDIREQYKNIDYTKLV